MHSCEIWDIFCISAWIYSICDKRTEFSLVSYPRLAIISLRSSYNSFTFFALVCPISSAFNYDLSLAISIIWCSYFLITPISLLINLSLSLIMILSSSLQSRMYRISALKIYCIESFFFAYISSKSCCWSSSFTRRRISYCSLVCYSSYRSSLQGNKNDF